MITTLQRWLLKTMLARLQTPRDVTRLACRRYAGRLALRQGERTLSYAELEDRVLRIATLWRRWGINHGQPVFCLLPDGIEQMLIRLAAAEAGAMLTLLRPEDAASRLPAALETIKPQLVVHPPEMSIAPFESGRLWPFDDAAHKAIDSVTPAADEKRLNPDELAVVGFTSGTTGNPKALGISHRAHLTSLRQVVANIDFSQRRLFKQEQDRFLVGVPLTGAGSGVVLPTLLSGSCLIIPERYDAETLLGTLEEHQATRLFTTPSLLIDLLDHPDLRPLPHLRLLIYGTELMPAAKLEEALGRFGAILQQGYGSAEVLPPVSLLSPAEHLAPGSEGDRQPAAREILMSAGRIVPGVQARIVDELDQDLPAGEIGEVLIKSPTVFSGYWRRPDLTGTALRDGYLVTGDMGRISNDGYLTILGRKTDLVSRQGRVIYPRLVEETAHDHPAVKEASLVQVQNQAILAVSLRRAWRWAAPPKSGWPAELMTHLRQHLPEESLPDRIVVFEELPRSSLSKVLRRDVRTALEATPQQQEQLT
ncbi:MAG: AMP-binding protein [Candidatus Thiodiazotropha sp.]